MSEVVGQLHIKQELQDCSFSGATPAGGGGGGGSSAAGANMESGHKNTSGSTSSSSTVTRSYSNSNSNSNSCHKCSPSASPERISTTTTSTTTTTTTTISNNSTNTTSAGGGGATIRDELRRLCLVCGDVASGFHYGVASCEACKAFFKRTIQGNIEYTCPANNECEINKRRRKACQACRFQKCLLMGMLKEGVRLDRVRGGRQKYRRNPASNSYQTMQLLYQSSATTLDDIKILEILNNFEPELFSVHAAVVATSQKREDNALSNGTSEDSAHVKYECNSNSNQSSSSSSTGSSAASSTKLNKRDKLLTHALNALQQSNNNNNKNKNNNNNNLINNNNNNNNNLMKSNHNNNNNNNNNYEREDILNMLSDIYDKELLSVIGWAKQIPGFPELPLNDQMKLLQISWAEILTLQLAFRSLPFNGRLCFANDLWMDELLAKECGYLEFYYHCVQIAQRLERVQLRREEYFLLKALLLSNCDILLDDQSSLRAFRNTILNSLNDVVYLLRRSSAVSHQQQLLLLLPSLRQADGILRRIWRQIQQDDIVNLKMLFVEMLEPPLLR